MSSSTPTGASLSQSPALALSWDGPLPANTVPSFASGSLRGLDLATFVASPDVIAQRLLPRGTAGVSLPVQDTATTGYVAELRWHGPYQVTENADGFCGCAKRLFYAR